MRRFLYRLFFTGMVLFFLLGNVFAQSGQGIQQETSNTKKIPQGFQSLVPQGFTLDSPQTGKVITAGGVPNGGNASGWVSFRAFKKVDRRSPVDEITYHFDMKIMEYPDFMIKMRAPLYREQLEKDIQDLLKSCSSRSEENNLSPVVSYAKPQITRYSWGAGITQRATHKYMGEGKVPDEIVYECSYLGLLIDNRSIKLLEFSASGVSTPGEANAWAVKAAEKAAQTFVSDL